MNNFGSLPIELVELVLDHITIKKDLYQCAYINKSFYMAANQRLWHEPIEIKQNIHMFYSSLKPSLLQTIHTARFNPLHAVTPLGHHVRKLIFEKDKDVLSIIKMLEYCPFVEELILVHLQLTDEDMACIFGLCPRLKMITLHLIDDITDTSIIALVRLCLNLEGIVLGVNEQLTIKSLITLKECPLKRLAITNCLRSLPEWSTPVQSDLLTVNTIQQLLPIDGSAPFPLLTELNLSSPLFRHKEIMDALVAFIKIHPNFYKLGTTYCTMNDYFFTAIATIPNLRQLNLSEVLRTYSFTHVYPQLQELSIELINGNRDILYSIADTMPNLKSLAIKSKNQLSPVALHQIIIKCTGLGFLDLSDYDLAPPSIPGATWGTKRILGKGKLNIIRRAPVVWKKHFRCIPRYW